ncbi:MAG: protease modulator HflC [Paludibacterium sp.]|uniref:protease modulator HflC n=1 Tax=Paludibacterium sp. TaxID=1917523 RepID=UPI0025D3F640|nr:protease modulator HflC [Paludibacterium sp.]MBV8049164.1 protease modulator HflC [Paludibacterium sp.]MBV8649303.1 protease modulator HflC [Paludibacterium sp.]
MRQHVRGVGLLVAVAAIWLAASAVYTLPEGQKALVIRMGAPIDVDEQPGLKLKWPLIDSVQYFDARLQTLAPAPEELILGDEKRLEVETYTRYRIVDPLRFYQTVHTEEQARAQLTQLVSTTLRRELGKAMIRSLLSDDRARILEQVASEVAVRARPLGIDVREVRLHRADLPLETSQAIYDRMVSERQQEAKELRAQGAEWAQQIQAKADSEKTVILSEAQRQSAIIHGEADAEANAILGKAFGRDPKFYKFYRSMQTYKQSLADTNATVILAPDSAFMHDFKDGPPGVKP